MIKCSVKKCNSGMQGLYKPILLLWADGARPGSHLPVSVEIKNKTVCLLCSQKIKPMQIIPFKDWMRIVSTVVESGLRPPSLATAKLTFMVPETSPNGHLSI